MKNKLIQFLLLPALLLSTTLQVLPADYPVDYIPQSAPASKNIVLFNVERTTPAKRLAVLSLQGLVNRTTPEIYTCVNQDSWITELYTSLGHIEKITTVTEFYDLLEMYKSVPKGAVVYDPYKKYTVNLATNVAGVEDRVILSPDMVDDFKRITGSNDINDLRDHNFSNQTAAFQWYKANIFPKQNHQILAVAKDLLLMYDVYRDYLVEFKIPVFWLPGKNDRDYEESYEKEIIKLFEETPVNIPVLGFWAGVENGKDVGYTEYEGVTFAGNYGKYTLVNTWVGNYSYHSGVKTDRTAYRQEKPRAKNYRTYDPDKKYVALIMNESGDAPCYFLYTGFFPRQWNDPYRGQVAVSYGITPSLRMLAPGILDHMYNTQSENDYFYTSISGAGYCYPFEGYCSKTDNPDQYNTDYFNLTAENMEILDFEMLGIYTHPSGKWSAADHEVTDRHMVPMKGLKSIISGMHRTGYTGKNAHELLGKVTVHHTLTHWPAVDYTWTDEAQDDMAVQFMENEIRAYGFGGQFTQAMFYSWMYGPRRLYKLQQKMAADGYEFVTLDEFDYLCRTANQWEGGASVSNHTEGDKLDIFPNPTQNKTIQFSLPVSGKIQFTDLQGQIIKSIPATDCTKVDLSDLRNGMYLVDIVTTDNDKIVKKVILN